MLNKRICQQCFKQQHLTANCRLYLGGGRLWTKDDDKRWKQGYVNCMFNADDCIGLLVYGVARTDQPPPEHCEYRLEHIIGDDKC